MSNTKLHLVRAASGGAVHCPNVKRCLDGDSSSPCCSIVKAQGNAWKEFQLAATAPLRRALGGQDRTLVFLPHPNARGVAKSFAKNYPADIDRLRALLA